MTVAGGASVSSKRRVAPIASLQSWLQAWSTFAEVLSAAFPTPLALPGLYCALKPTLPDHGVAPV